LFSLRRVGLFQPFNRSAQFKPLKPFRNELALLPLAAIEGFLL